jgi:hypothetical protein
MATGMIIDGVFASQAIDSSGEILDVEGCDISTLDKDGVLNYEHKEGDKKDPKGGNNGEEIVGKIVYCHKIFSEKDCETDRQRMYWNKVGHLPFIYGMCRLYDGAGHSGAQALAAQIRDHNANNEPILVRFSIEGSTLDRKGNRLTTSVARRVAATLKPCNRTAISGLIEDPRAPDGFDKSPTKQEKPVKDILSGLLDDKRDEDDTKKREHEHPMYTKLGGEFEIECSPLIKDEGDLYKAIKLVVKARMLKALAAGNYNSAPSTLTGGAALQREDLHSIKNRALAVLRDHGKKRFNKGEFKAILKAKLPEADDSFIDHFADLAEDYHVKLKKIEGLVKKEKKLITPQKVTAPKTTVDPAGTKPTAYHDSRQHAHKTPELPTTPEPAPMQLTIRGKPAPAPKFDKLFFDEKTGTLHIPANKRHTGGQFRMYIPGRHDPMIHKSKSDAKKELDSFNSIMQDPKVNEFHDYAMDNWQKVNGLLGQGKLPPEVVMHATLFSQLSPNTPVPMQEYMYGHLVDSMKHTGIDARDPRFSSIKEDWMGRDTGKQAPQVSPEHWERVAPQIKIKTPSYEMVPKPGTANAGRSGKNLIPAVDAQGNKIVKRPAGSYGSFMLANNKFKNMAKYYALHDRLVDHINRHGPDARSAVNELMSNKDQAGKWEATRQRAIAAGKPDPGEFKNLEVEGLAPKTARYMYGMLGGGNVTVPDTHFTRYLFGLEKGQGSKTVDNETIEEIKRILWNEQNSHILEGIDRHYAQHHPAVKHMLEHPRYGQLFKNDPEQAVFPAFWKNWVGIVPHEQARGYNTAGVNEYTDHRPFWETIDPFLKKNEDDIEHTLPMRTAMIHNEWVHRFGEMPAMMMYYRHLAPRLMAAAEARMSPQASIRKMEAFTIELRKAAAEIKDSTETRSEEHDDGAVHFAGHHVLPGRARTMDGEFALLHEDKTHYVAIPADKLGQWDPEHLTKFPKVKEGTHFHVMSRPSVLVADLEK